MLNNDYLESIWDALLSRDPVQILPAYTSLDPSSQAVVLAHLDKMAHEDGWHPEQRRSALAALDVILPQAGTQASAAKESSGG